MTRRPASARVADGVSGIDALLLPTATIWGVNFSVVKFALVELPPLAFKRFALAVAYVLWSFGIARLGSARTALYNNLVLPIAVITAWLALGETLTPVQITGVVLALVGVTLARRHARPASG